MVFFEAPQRLADFLADAAAACGDARRAVVAREITKLHERVYHGTLAELALRSREDADLRRGEVVVVVAGAVEAAQEDRVESDRVLRILLKSLSPSRAAALAAEITGASRNDCYQRALQLGRDAGAESPLE